MRLNNNNKNCVHITTTINEETKNSIQNNKNQKFLLLLIQLILLLLLLFHPMITMIHVHAYYDVTIITTRMITTTRTINNAEMLSVPKMLFIPRSKFFSNQQQKTQKLYLYSCNNIINNNNYYYNIAFVTVPKLRFQYQSSSSYSRTKQQQQQYSIRQKSVFLSPRYTNVQQQQQYDAVTRSTIVGQNSVFTRLFSSNPEAYSTSTSTSTTTTAIDNASTHNNNNNNCSNCSNNWVQDRIDVLMKKYNNTIGSNNNITVYDLMKYSLQIFDEEEQQQIAKIRVSSFTIGNNSVNENDNSDSSNNDTTIDLEPIQSTINILSYVLQLPWDSGYKDLQQIINTMNDANNKDSLSSLSYTIVSTNHILQFINLLYRRIVLYEPIQYIIGQWDFLKYILKIQSPLLCPRPETEELVVLAINDINKQQQEQRQDVRRSRKSIRILDIGCGTGCIGISIADQIPNSYVIGIDIEPIAITVSMINAKSILGDEQLLHNRYSTMLTSIQDFNSLLLNNLKNNDSTDREAASNTDTYDTNNNENGTNMLFDYVISNPPYILKNEMQTLSPVVVNHESIYALSDNSSIDGMDIIRTIIQKLPILCNTNAICWIEVDPKQPLWIQQYLLQQQQYSESSSSINENNNHDNSKHTKTTTMKKYVKYISTHQDLYGKDRFVKLQVLCYSS